MNLFEQKPYTEQEVVERIGVTRQTLRNWRVGHGKYPPRLKEGEQWYKLRQTRCSPVMYDRAWVDSMAEIHQQKKELMQ